MQVRAFTAVLVVLQAVVIGGLAAHADYIADTVVFANPITGTNPGQSSPNTASQIIAPGVAKAEIGRGPDLTIQSTNNRYNSSGWSPSFHDDKYYYFAFEPSPGYVINLVELQYSGQRSNTGPNSFAFRSSVDEFANDVWTRITTTTGTPEKFTIDLRSPDFQSLTSPIEFRLYGWGAGGSSGTFSINDFAFTGSVVAVPEPASLALCGLASAGLLVVRRAHQRKRRGKFEGGSLKGEG